MPSDLTLNIQSSVIFADSDIYIKYTVACIQWISEYHNYTLLPISMIPCSAASHCKKTLDFCSVGYNVWGLFVV